MSGLDEATLLVGQGIEGDRYAAGTGYYSDRPHLDRQVTLIEAEVLEALARDHRVELHAREHRRNLTTTGVPLNHLVGRYFSVGDCVLYGGRLNVPCSYLQDLTGKRVFRPLVHRSGLNARVVVGGSIRVGDEIAPVERANLPAPLVTANEQTPVEAAPEVI